MGDINGIKEHAAILAKNFFGLSLPFTEKELSKSYRRAVKLLRPDLGLNKEELEEFVQVQSARDLLRSFAGFFGGIIQEKEPDQIKWFLNETEPRDKGPKVGLRLNIYA